MRLLFSHIIDRKKTKGVKGIKLPFPASSAPRTIDGRGIPKTLRNNLVTY